MSAQGFHFKTLRPQAALQRILTGVASHSESDIYSSTSTPAARLRQL